MKTQVRVVLLILILTCTVGLFLYVDAGNETAASLPNEAAVPPPLEDGGGASQLAEIGARSTPASEVGLRLETAVSRQIRSIGHNEVELPECNLINPFGQTIKPGALPICRHVSIDIESRDRGRESVVKLSSYLGGSENYFSSVLTGSDSRSAALVLLKASSCRGIKFQSELEFIQYSHEALAQEALFYKSKNIPRPDDCSVTKAQFETAKNILELTGLDFYKNFRDSEAAKILYNSYK